MKVAMMEDWKKILTVSQYEAAKAVIAYEKVEDSNKPSDWLEYAAREYLNGTDQCVSRVVEARAEIALNGRVWNVFEGAGSVDVWVSGLVRTSDGYLEVGAYLSDIWQTGSTPYKAHVHADFYQKK